MTTRTHVRIRRSAAALIVMTLALAACGGGGGSKGGGGGSGKGGNSVTVAADLAKKPTPGGELTFALEATNDGGWCLAEAQLAHLTPDPDVIAATQSQGEFVRPIWDYIEASVTPARVESGQRKLAEYADMIGDVQASEIVDAAAARIAAIRAALPPGYDIAEGGDGELSADANRIADLLNRYEVEKLRRALRTIELATGATFSASALA